MLFHTGAITPPRGCPGSPQLLQGDPGAEGIGRAQYTGTTVMCYPDVPLQIQCHPEPPTRGPPLMTPRGQLI